MKILISLILALLLAIFGFLLPRSISPGAVRPCEVIYSKINDRLFVISEEPGQILQLDPETAKPLHQIELPYKLSGAVLNGSGNRLFVTANGADGRILEIDTDKLIVLRDFSSGGHTPVSPVISPDERSLYVCNRFNNEVAQIYIVKAKVVNRHKVMREPVDLVFSMDGRYLFAGNFLPAERSDADQVAATISVIDLEKGFIENIELPNGSHSIGGMALSPDGRYIYVTHILARFQVPTTQLERGWMNTNALSIIDAKKRVLSASVLLDDRNLGFPNPRAIAFSSDGASLLVTSFGGEELSVINRNDLHSMIEGVISQDVLPNSYSDPANDLTLMSKINRKRIKLPGHGPGSMVVEGNMAYITEYYSGTLCVMDLNDDHSCFKKQIAFGKEDPFSDINRYGEMLFNSANLCFQKWQSCASCHPDARVDGLKWDLLNDGIGNSKNTKSMLHAHITPPAMSLGVRSTAEQGVRSGIHFIQFAEVDEKKAVAIDTYLKALRPVPSPYMVKNRLSRSASRGKKIFNREKCISCHPPPLYSDLKKYNVKSGKGIDKDKAFDTPALVEAWRTAPYMHDGSVLTMEELIRVHNPDGSSSLSEKENAELAVFVLSL